jgi:hypothetical protein
MFAAVSVILLAVSEWLASCEAGDSTAPGRNGRAFRRSTRSETSESAS